MDMDIQKDQLRPKQRRILLKLTILNLTYKTYRFLCHDIDKDIIN